MLNGDNVCIRNEHFITQNAETDKHTWLMRNIKVYTDFRQVEYYLQDKLLVKSNEIATF
jgi:hypothetical protein